MASSLGKFDFEGCRVSVLSRRREHLCNQHLQFEIAPEFVRYSGGPNLSAVSFIPTMVARSVYILLCL